MKRLIIVSMMVMSVITQAESATINTDITQTGVEATVPQSNQTDDDAGFGASLLEIENISSINLDTIEGGSGNWLEKRIWFSRAELAFDEIRATVNKIADIRIQFSNEVNTVGQKIDTFYEVVDFKKNELEDKFKEILAQLETEQKLTGDLTEEERNLQATIKQEITSIDQIGKDIKSIHDVDIKIDDTLKQAFKTIDECRDYETKAWDTFKAIGKELDDKKARNLYYQMNNFKQNIDQKTNYLKATLFPYLHNVLVAKVETSISKINESIEKLKAKGVDVQAIMSKTQENDLVKSKEREKIAIELAVKEALEKDALEEKEVTEVIDKAVQEDTSEKSSLVQRAKSYSYPVVTYIYDWMVLIRSYMHDVVESVMTYFDGQKDKDTKKDSTNEQAADEAAKDKDVNKAENTSEDTKSDVKIVEKEDKKSTPEVAKKSVDETPKTQVAETVAVETVTSPLLEMDQDEKESLSVADDTVVVQSMNHSQNNNTSNDSSTMFTIFQNCIDLIATIFTSIYNLVQQVFMLLLSFSSWLTSSK